MALNFSGVGLAKIKSISNFPLLTGSIKFNEQHVGAKSNANKVHPLANCSFVRSHASLFPKKFKLLSVWV